MSSELPKLNGAASRETRAEAERRIQDRNWRNGGYSHIDGPQAARAAHLITGLMLHHDRPDLHPAPEPAVSDVELAAGLWKAVGEPGNARNLRWVFTNPVRPSDEL